MKQIYTSIDVGSNSIKIVAAEMYKNKFNILASVSVDNVGMKKGLIIDADTVTNNIKTAFKQLNDMLGAKIDKVIACIPIYYTDITFVTGYSTITNSEKEIRGNDIVRALQASVYNKLDASRELVNIVPLEFNVDNKTGIRDPKGLIGDKIEVNALMVTAPKKNVHSVIAVIENAGVKVIDVVISGMADYFAFKTTHTDTDTGVIINIGSETTSVSLFNKGVLLKGEVLPLGSKNIDNDISYIYKLDKENSKKVKEEFAVAHKKAANVTETLEIENINGESININQAEVSDVVMSRLFEILNLSKKQINLLTKREISYIIITGGISEMPGFEYVTNEVFENKGSVGNINIMGIRNNMYATAIGAIKVFYDKLSLRGKSYSMFSDEQERDLVSSKRRMLNFNDNSVIGKVFGYFFES